MAKYGLTEFTDKLSVQMAIQSTGSAEVRTVLQEAEWDAHPLLSACVRGAVDEVKSLLDKADLSIEDSQGWVSSALICL